MCASPRWKILARCDELVASPAAQIESLNLQRIAFDGWLSKGPSEVCRLE
jgi:hypothetical protein